MYSYVGNWTVKYQFITRPIYYFEELLKNCFCVSQTYRISTARKEKAGSRLVFRQIEPNCPLSYSTVPVLQLRDARAGLPIAVYARVQCRDPKQGRKRFNSMVKTIHSSYLPAIYLWSQSPQRLWNYGIPKHHIQYNTLPKHHIQYNTVNTLPKG